MRARRSIPVRAPAPPRVRACGGIERRIPPRAVHREFDARDAAVAGPGAAGNLDAARIDDAAPAVVIRDAGRRHEAIDAHAGAGNPLFAGHAAEMIAERLLHAVEGAVDRLDALEPLHATHAVPVWPDGAHGA